MSHVTTTSEPEHRYLLIGGALSLVIHLIFGGLIAQRPLPPEPTAIVVDLIPPLPDSVSPRRIVSPSEQSQPIIPPVSSRLSDQDAAVIREEIRRGDAPDAGPAPAPPGGSQGGTAKSSTAPRQPAPPVTRRSAPAQSSPQEQSSGPRLKTLTLDAATMRREFAPNARDATPRDRDNADGPVEPAGYAAFSRPSGSGARLLGLRGSSDYLPNLPDGDLTLLNTKANLYAVFVRRVATQVFGQLRQSGWDLLSAGDISRIGEYSVVTATLSKQGELLDVRLLSSSGSPRFDEILAQAARRGARDPNPPAGAESSDGTIRFLFKARSWVRMSSDPRTGAVGERRWILLGTGLE